MMMNKYELRVVLHPGILLVQSSKRNTRTIRKIYSTFPIKTQERRH